MGKKLVSVCYGCGVAVAAMAVVLLFGAAAISCGLLEQGGGGTVTAGAALLGGLLGGRCAARRWSEKWLWAALLTGGVTVGLLLMVGGLFWPGSGLTGNWAVVPVGCLCGSIGGGWLAMRRGSQGARRKKSAVRRRHN